jgi:hypothetical protein
MKIVNPKLLVQLSLVLVFCYACKKGEKDPAISFRTRKARLCGEWRMISGSISLSETAYNENYVLDGSNLTLYTTPTGGVPIIYKGRYILGLTIKKDGTFTFKETRSYRSIEASGTWRFNSGVGKSKSKEKVLFTIEDVANGFTYGYHLFNVFSTSFSYDIVELRNKELILESTDLVQASERQGNLTHTASYKFIQ